MSEEYDGKIAKYKVLGEIEYTDEKGEPQGKLEVGSIQEVPEELGDKWVEQGVAELVDETQPDSVDQTEESQSVPEEDTEDTR